MLRFTSLLALCLLLGGCVHQSGGIASSTRPLAPDGYEVLGDAFGRDCIYHLFGVLPVSGSNNTHSAVTQAIRSEPGATDLINVTVENYAHYFVILTRQCTAVIGKAVRAH